MCGWQFTLSYPDFGFWTNEPGGRFIVEPGDFTLTVGDGSQAREVAFLLS